MRLVSRRVVKLDVVSLGAPDDALLLRNRKGAPGGQIVQIFLHDNIRTARELRVLVADQRGAVEGASRRILRAIYEPQKVTVVEIAKSLHLVHDGDCVAERIEEEPFQFETQVALLGADMEEEVPWRRYGGV